MQNIHNGYIKNKSITIHLIALYRDYIIVNDIFIIEDKAAHIKLLNTK